MISYGFETAVGPVPYLARVAAQQVQLRVWAALPGTRVLSHTCSTCSTPAPSTR
jgi:hypothetical protein